MLAKKLPIHTGAIHCYSRCPVGRHLLQSTLGSRQRSQGHVLDKYRKVSTNASPGDDSEKPSRRALEDELRDPKTALEYFLPRPLRIGFFAITSVSCLIAVVLGGLNLIQGSMADPLLSGDQQSSTVATDLVVNLIGCVVFAALAVADKQAGEQRIVQRKELRQKQIKSGDREVYLNEEGERMSKLKEVDDAWILRRLERWGRKDAMPFLGDKKGAILQSLVEDKKPKLAVEVGTMAGYSAILIGQKLPKDGRLVTYEKDLFWFLAAKRFLWQASQGSNVKSRPEERLDRKVMKV
ncbi:hypothetical protein DUNSADRAFT_6647 [Dunaliella salina]|uniref:catechol O-methyltransferase n=1 Tax=Dunaliella salina TaxID=3046 RepID=A0ABQ7GMW5_DUNSA|nr:hypothetical protein DUNSADRAFT_6647 [Dunaliella salina]|eukprot:KAF5835936.1 hypothetical protein DUNSADRAFT_6647 [Dunaliella salina]